MSGEKTSPGAELAVATTRETLNIQGDFLDEKKPEDFHVENVDDHDANFIPKSPFDDMGFVKTIKVFKWATFLAMLAAFSAAADGYQIAMTGNVIANEGFVEIYWTQYNAKGAKILAADILAAWGGIQSAGQGFAMISMNFIADRYGRKKAMFGLWLSLVIAVFCETFGRHWRVWLVAKLFSGYGVGAVQFLTGTYISEIAPPRIRGFLLLFYSVWYGIGQLMATTALRVMRLDNPKIWLPLIYSEWATIGIMFLIYCFIPESPWWCANNGHHERGLAMLKRINGGVQGYDVDAHYDILRRTVEHEMGRNGIESGRQITIWENIKSTKEIFVGTNGFRTLIAFMPAAVQQLTGLAVIGQYSSYFAQQTGFADPFLFTVILSLVAIIITVLGAVATDIIGRRVLFLGATLTTWSMLLVIGGLGLSKRNTSLDKLLVFFSMVWRMASTILGDLGWSYVAETGTSRLRARTAGFAAAGGVCFGLVFSTSVPYMLNANAANWGLKTMFFFAGISAPLCIGSVFIMPDISKRTPAELDEMFEKKIKPWRFRSYVTEAQKALQEERENSGVQDPTAEARP